MLLGENDPDPVLMPKGKTVGSILLTCEHAGLRIPHHLGNLGISTEDLRDHIGWDAGALDVTRSLSDALDLPFIAQVYSRLVIDCNRPRDAPDLVPTVADARTVSGNLNLSDSDVNARWFEIHQPFHAKVAQLARAAGALLSVHSFTPTRRVDTAERAVHIGVLARDNNPLFQHLMQRLPDVFDGAVVANAPYEIEDQSDYTIPVHAEALGLPHALVEIRNDLISDPRVAAAFTAVLREFSL